MKTCLDIFDYMFKTEVCLCSCPCLDCNYEEYNPCDGCIHDVSYSMFVISVRYFLEGGILWEM